MLLEWGQTAAAGDGHAVTWQFQPWVWIWEQAFSSSCDQSLLLCSVLSTVPEWWCLQVCTGYKVVSHGMQWVQPLTMLTQKASFCCMMFYSGVTNCIHTGGSNKHQDEWTFLEPPNGNCTKLPDNHEVNEGLFLITAPFSTIHSHPQVVPVKNEIY